MNNYKNALITYAFDQWMKRTYPQSPFARYADDAVVSQTIGTQRELLCSSAGLLLRSRQRDAEHLHALASA